MNLDRLERSDVLVAGSDCLLTNPLVTAGKFSGGELFVDEGICNSKRIEQQVVDPCVLPAIPSQLDASTLGLQLVTS